MRRTDPTTRLSTYEIPVHRRTPGRVRPANNARNNRSTRMRAITRSWWGGLGAGLSLAALVFVLFGSGVGAASAGGPSFTFQMVPSTPAIASCLPRARATVTILSTSTGQVMTIHASGLAPRTGYDLFVTQIPHAKFGLSWYQS